MREAEERIKSQPPFVYPPVNKVVLTLPTPPPAVGRFSFKVINPEFSLKYNE
jgi:hypothetical protein